MKPDNIQRIDIVTSAGAKTYTVGGDVNGNKIFKIKLAELYFTGDPFDHYCGYTESGEMIFSINCLTPCVVEY